MSTAFVGAGADRLQDEGAVLIPFVVVSRLGTIYRIDPNDTSVAIVVFVTNDSARTMGRITWNPDDRKLYFIDTGGADANNLFSVNIDGSGLAELGGVVGTSTRDIDWGVAWHPTVGADGKPQIAINTVNRKSVMNDDGTNHTSWSTTNFDQRDIAALHGEADFWWTVDSSGLLIKRNYRDGTSPGSGGSNISSMVSDPLTGEAYYQFAQTIFKRNTDVSFGGTIVDLAAEYGITALHFLLGIFEAKIWFLQQTGGTDYILSYVTIADPTGGMTTFGSIRTAIGGAANQRSGAFALA